MYRNYVLSKFFHNSKKVIVKNKLILLFNNLNNRYRKMIHLILKHLFRKNLKNLEQLKTKKMMYLIDHNKKIKNWNYIRNFTNMLMWKNGHTMNFHGIRRFAKAYWKFLGRKIFDPIRELLLIVYWAGKMYLYVCQQDMVKV